MAAAEGPLRLGIIGDIQYADVEDGSDFSGKERRYFRNALRIAQSAIEIFNANGCDAVVQMGDVIDGLNSKGGNSEVALFTVLNVLNESTARLGRFDLVGNHELYNFTREALPSLLSCSDGSSGKMYRVVNLNNLWDAIFLDPYEVGLIGRADDDPSALKAREILAENNPQVLGCLAGGDWLAGLPEDRHRFVPYNGSVSEEQLEWLRGALAESTDAGRRVLVFTHVPVWPASTTPSTLMWNADEVLDALHTHPDTVVAVIAGHNHQGGYAVDPAGVHHVTMNAPLTAKPGSECCAILDCYEGWAVLRAYGRACVESRTDGAGGSYPELILARGACNEHDGVGAGRGNAMADTGGMGDGGSGGTGEAGGGCREDAEVAAPEALLPADAGAAAGGCDDNGNADVAAAASSSTDAGEGDAQPDDAGGN